MIQQDKNAVDVKLAHSAASNGGKGGVPVNTGFSYRGLALAGWACVGLLLAWLTLTNPYQKDPQVLILAAAVVVLGVRPLLEFLRRGHGAGVPAFELHCLFYAVCFGLVGFMPDEGMPGLGDVEHTVPRALMATVLGLVLMQLGYFGLGRAIFKERRTPDLETSTPDLVLGLICFGMWLSTVVVDDILRVQVLRRIMLTLSWFSFFTLAFLVFQKRLPWWFALMYVGAVIPYEVLMRAGAQKTLLFGSIMCVAWLLFVYNWARGRFPVLGLVLLGGVLLLLHPAKATWRNDVTNRAVSPSRWEVLKAYPVALYEYYFSPYRSRARSVDSIEKTARRMNQLVTLAAVMRDTPNPHPYLHGETYKALLTKWIPRLIWPSKPREDWGNRWGRLYGYLGEEDFTTSFNLPWLPEMYINFGWYGILVLMFVVGLLFRFLWAWLLWNPSGPVGYGVTLALVQNISYPESNFSLQFGDVVIGAIELSVVVMGLKILGNVLAACSMVQPGKRLLPYPAPVHTAPPAVHAFDGEFVLRRGVVGCPHPFSSRQNGEPHGFEHAKR